MSEVQAAATDEVRTEYPAGVPCWVDTFQADPEAAMAFYSGLFGWEFDDHTPPGAPPYALATLRGRLVAGLGGLPPGAPANPAWNTYVAVDDAAAAVARAVAAGGSVVLDADDVGSAGRMAVLADAEGAVVSVWQAGDTHGAELVNEAGTWNFSGLNTRDAAAARAFYGAVFGWESAAMDGAGEMWMMPGYGDHLEARRPGMRAAMADMGAPERFEDVVAWLTPMTDETFPGDAPPHWGITFAVADADDAAARAERLGAAVVAPPFDAPWVRMAVVQDPQGSVLTLSQFVPPEG